MEAVIVLNFQCDESTEPNGNPVRKVAVLVWRRNLLSLVQ